MQKKSYGSLKLCILAGSKKVTLSKKKHIFLFLFLLQDNGHFFIVLKFQVSKLQIAKVEYFFIIKYLPCSKFKKGKKIKYFF